MARPARRPADIHVRPAALREGNTLRRSRALVAGLLLAGSACVHNRGTAAGSGERLPAAREVRVHVTNRYEISMEVSVTGSGITHRLGLVSPGIARSFVLPQALAGSYGAAQR